MSGVNGFVGSNIPEPNESWSLHRLGSPCPDSSTKTSNSLDSPFERNAIPVGKFSPEAKTETLNPGGTTMSSPLPGLNETDSRGQSGFATVAGSATAGNVEARMPAKYPSRRIVLLDAVLRYLLIANLPFAVTQRCLHQWINELRRAKPAAASFLKLARSVSSIDFPSW